MKSKVLAFLKDGSGVPEERYNEAMALLQKSEGKSVAQVNSYYRSGFTETNLKNICYDLQQLHGIPDVEIASGSKKSTKSAEGTKSKVQSTKSDGGTKTIGDIEVHGAETVTGTDVTQNRTDVTNTETIETVTPLVEEIKKSDDAVKGGLKLRERFAFLGEYDCPDKLKILVSDMLSAWDAFKVGHAALMVVTEEGKEDKSLTDAEIYELAKETIEAFQLNHAIWDELEFYNEHKEVLGNHPIFADDQLKEKVAAMSDVDLVNRQKNVRSYISKENKKLKSAKDEAATTKIKKKIQELNQELNLLDERIGAKK